MEANEFWNGHPGDECSRCGSYGHLYNLGRDGELIEGGLCPRCILTAARADADTPRYQVKADGSVEQIECAHCAAADAEIARLRATLTKIMQRAETTSDIGESIPRVTIMGAIVGIHSVARAALSGGRND